MRGRPKGSGRRSVAIPLTRIHILHRRNAEGGGEGGDRGTVGYPPFRVCLCTTVGSLLLYSFQSESGDAQQDPRGGTRRVGGEGDRDRGPPSPYIISSPERVAIISRQWLTDRSASQKGPGPIIAATHRPRRCSGQSWGPLRLLVCFFPPMDEFLPTATGPATSITRRVSRGETPTTETGYSGGMRVSNIPRHESCRAIFARISETKKKTHFTLHCTCTSALHYIFFTADFIF